MYLNFQLQSKNFQQEFDASGEDPSSFEEAIEEMGIIEMIVEILKLLISKTYTISLKLMNFYNEKEQDNVDFMAYKRLFVFFQQSNEKRNYCI